MSEEAPTSALDMPTISRLLSDPVKARELSEHENDPNYYGCFARVKNSGGKLVGQLTGSCGQITAEGSVKAGSKPKLCIPKIATRKVFADYSVGTLSKKTGGDYSLATDIENVFDDGANVCANVPVNTMYCASAVAKTAATATADVGSGACPAMKNIADKIEVGFFLGRDEFWG